MFVYQYSTVIISKHKRAISGSSPSCENYPFAAALAGDTHCDFGMGKTDALHASFIPTNHPQRTGSDVPVRVAFITWFDREHLLADKYSFRGDRLEICAPFLPSAETRRRTSSCKGGLNW
jgi:hypothetical protein